MNSQSERKHHGECHRIKKRKKPIWMADSVYKVIDSLITHLITYLISGLITQLITCLISRLITQLITSLISGLISSLMNFILYRFAPESVVIPKYHVLLVANFLVLKIPLEKFPTHWIT